MRAAALILLALALAGCETARVADLSRPCGVLTDSLRDVAGASPADTRRIDIHFERGLAAKCWTR